MSINYQFLIQSQTQVSYLTTDIDISIKTWTDDAAQAKKYATFREANNVAISININYKLDIQAVVVLWNGESVLTLPPGPYYVFTDRFNVTNKQSRLFLVGNVGPGEPWIEDINSARKFDSYEEALNVALSVDPSFQAKVFPPPTLFAKK